MKRILCIVLGLSLLLGAVGFAYAEEAEEEPEFSAEEEKEIEEEEKEAESDGIIVEGEVYHEKTKDDFDLNSPAIYTGVIRTDFGKVIWAEKNTDKTTKSYPAAGRRVDILYVGLRWLIVRMDNIIGYVLPLYLSVVSGCRNPDPVIYDVVPFHSLLEQRPALLIFRAQCGCPFRTVVCLDLPYRKRKHFQQVVEELF